MLCIEKDNSSNYAESFRMLRTNIQYNKFDKDIKSILVTSSVNGEGKTTVACNLAISMAENRKNVILIDCDIKNPSIHKFFSISNALGLSDVILEKQRLDTAITKYKDNLFILPGGSPNEKICEILSSSTMENFLEQLEETFDYIILDSASITKASYTQVLANNVDTTLLVARPGTIKSEEIKKSKELLSNVKAHILGIVMNGTKNGNKKD